MLNLKGSEQMKIAIEGTGYVGLSLAVLLAQNHMVEAVDILPEKVEMINKKVSPIQDREIMEYLTEKPGADGTVHKLNLHATLDAANAYRSADFVIVAAPTNYDPQKNFFDTSAVEEVVRTVTDVNKNHCNKINHTCWIYGIAQGKVPYRPYFVQPGVFKGIQGAL